MCKRGGIKALLPPGISISGIKTIFMSFCDSRGKTVLAECVANLFRNIFEIYWEISSSKIVYISNIFERYWRGWCCWNWWQTDREIDRVQMLDICETMCEWQVGLVWHVNPLNPDPCPLIALARPTLLLYLLFHFLLTVSFMSYINHQVREDVIKYCIF